MCTLISPNTEAILELYGVVLINVFVFGMILRNAYIKRKTFLNTIKRQG